MFHMFIMTDYFVLEYAPPAAPPLPLCCPSSPGPAASLLPLCSLNVINSDNYDA